VLFKIINLIFLNFTPAANKFILYVKKTNKMHHYLINLFQLNYPLHVLNKQVHHQQVISVHTAYSISHASMGSLAANMILLPLVGVSHIHVSLCTVQRMQNLIC
jgi:uncharacterized membrane protein